MSPSNSGAYGNALSMVEYGYKQFALFNVAPIYIQGKYLLKDIPKSSSHMFVNGLAMSQQTTVSQSPGVPCRPVFAYGR